MNEARQFLVVGGTSGIGLELVKQLSTHSQVRVWSRNNSSELPPGVEHENWDARSGQEMPEPPDSLDGMAYCPGSIRLKPIGRLSDDDFREDFEINCLGAVRTLRACTKALRRPETASVVLFSSVAVVQGMPMHTSIAAAKGAVEGMTRALAAELAPRVRVNAIAPSLVDTPMSELLIRDEKRKEAAAKRHPLLQIGTASEVAALADDLLRGQLTWMTGQILHLDGGMSSVRTFG